MPQGNVRSVVCRRFGGPTALVGLAAATALLSPAAATASGTGGAGFVPRPEIERVVCLTGCASERRPRAGSTIGLRGRALAAVKRVVFKGAGTRADDVAVRVRPRSQRSIRLRVPANAPSGPVSATVARSGVEVRSLPSKPLAILPPLPPIPNAVLSPVPGPRAPGAPRMETGTSATKVFAGAAGGVTFAYRPRSAAPVTMGVELIRVLDGAVVATWKPKVVQPGEVEKVRWTGLEDGALQPEGRYAFRLVTEAERGIEARSSQIDDPRRDAFDFHHHVFPIRGRHDYGEGGARFGAGRGGRGHQGHDVFAGCGTKLVAARGGVVKFKQYHAAAGHYLVIGGDRSGFDYAYMHLTAPSPFDEGDRVYTGQQIGTVGASGNARACHLHFELWSAPGWYDGGSPVDPLPALQTWDAYS